MNILREISTLAIAFVLLLLVTRVATITCPNGNSCLDDSFKDVVFVIDTSGSIGMDNFQLIREFTANLTTELICNSPRSEVGVILFGSTAYIEFNLQTHTNLRELLTAIDNLPYNGGSTNTAEALTLLRLTAQNGTLGLRNDSSKIAIVITDGQSNNLSTTSLAAIRLHNLSIFDVYAVGIGGANQDELRSIASNRDFAFFTTDFSNTSLQQLNDRILPQFSIAADGCSFEKDAIYGITWPCTAINMNATNNCLSGIGTAVRLCDSNGQWGEPVVRNCSSYEYRSLMTLMAQIRQAETPTAVASEINQLTSSLAVVSNRTDEGTSSYPADLMNANSLLQFSLDAIEQNPDILTTDETVQNIADTFSNILSPNNNVAWMELNRTNPGQSQMVLMNSERFALLLAENLEIGSNRMVVSENIIIVAELVDANNISDITFPDPNSNISLNSSIFIPASYIQQRAMTTGINPVPIVNINYENIQNILLSADTQPVSQVLSSQVTNTSATSPDIAVQLTFNYSVDSSDSTPVCAFWNFSLNEGRGGWDTEGVIVVSIDTNSSTIVCNSTHLTSFAVLVDVSGGHEDISETEHTALSIVSYIGCGISIVCLLIAIIVLVYYRNTLLKGIHNFIHLNLAIALILALIVFVSGIETATDSEVGCTIVAALLHYFFTAVFTWMLCEGIIMYFLLIKVFNTGLGQRKLFYLALGWGIPIPIVAISAGIAHDQYGHEDFCWIKTEDGAIWGFVGPMLAIIIVNIVFLAMALYSLYKNRKVIHKMTVQEAPQIQVVRTVLKATVILLPLLGITWVFGVLAVNQESSVFAWIFAVLNSLQGMFILIFHVVRNKMIWQKISSYWKNKESQQSSMTSPLKSGKIKKSQLKKNTPATSTDPPTSNIIMSDFQESTVTDNASKSIGIEAHATVEAENGKSEVIEIKPEKSVTSTRFTVNNKDPNQQ